MECQKNTPAGPCPELAVEGTKYCRRHSGTLLTDRQQVVQYNFETSETRQRIAHFQEHSERHSLETEIAMVKVLLEDLMRIIDGNDDVATVALAREVGELTKKLSAMIQTQVKLQKELKQLYPVSAIRNFLSGAVDVVAEELVNAEVEGYEEITSSIIDRFMILLDG